MNLFDYAERYPYAAGHRGVDTSIEAAKAITPKLNRLQQLVVNYLKANGPATSEQIAFGCNVAECAIQPRTSELKKREIIRDSGKRFKNTRGKKAIAWEAV